VSDFEGFRWVLALPAEATPLIEHYKLKLVRSHPFKVYANESMTQGLVISGIGRSASAAATIFLAEFMPSHQPLVFMNVGIAGARDLALGSLWRAHKVSCRSTGKVWYPGTLTPGICGSAALVTVDQPELDYPDESLFDMEAAGFFEMASKLTTLELIQSVKIISDNSKEDIQAINKAQVIEWVRVALEGVDVIKQELESLRKVVEKREPPGDWEEKIAATLHFSVTQRHRLKRLLARYWALDESEKPVMQCLSEAKSGADYLKMFEVCLESMPVMWGER